ncbi:hypothetical protein GlitD10_0395 [Gloeomargarita lithophora Alchichica-D10]|uniref:Uncharacterized protein n=1 Tax=Gloeomargarita lithophora Alchichica-D10 TaxID=1188229 RepID=A0A1J0A9U0_9CYAN|nr:hypothetical protein [Gloeomargarita lithophora]APB32706.1 hypothetical protein GlitD10_0395 [Gloeomargarita lithophora Alchichica-D10]
MSLINAFPRVGQLPPAMVSAHWQTGADLAVQLLDQSPAWVLVSPPPVMGATQLWLDSRELVSGGHLLCMRGSQWVFALVATPAGVIGHSFSPPVVERVWQGIFAQVTDGDVLGQLKAVPDHWPVAPAAIVEQFYQQWLYQTAQPPEDWARSVLHEIYTPLSTIGVWTDVLLKYHQELPQRVVQGLQAIAQEVRLRQELWHSWFEPQGCQAGLGDWREQAQVRGIVLDFDLAERLPPMLRQLLAQVMPLLLGELPPGAQIHGAVKQSQKHGQKVIILYLQFTALEARKILDSDWEWSPQTGRLYPSLARCQERLAALGGELHWQAQGLELTLPLEAMIQQGLGDEQVGGGGDF